MLVTMEELRDEEEKGVEDVMEDDNEVDDDVTRGSELDGKVGR